ncbi:MAG: GDP-mannose 4,6-dehydratase, partial [Romboutsia sp.]|nr:GDP-mannose 4,6-dehydratase [Romboutsia sp.]
MKKILVTGGAGFIGANFIYYMLNKYSNYKIVNLDKLTYASKIENLNEASKNNNYKFIKGDICDKDFIFNLFKNEKFDIVINFAAESHVDRSILSPEIFVNTNVLGTQILLDASIKYKVKRFHQVSTDEVYGDLPLDRKDLL